MALSEPGGPIHAHVAQHHADEVTVQLLYRLAARRARPFAVVLPIPKHRRTRIVQDVAADCYANAIAAEGNLDTSDKDSLRVALGKPWRTMVLTGHCDGAHLRLGAITLCGAVDEGRQTAADLSCTALRCRHHPDAWNVGALDSAVVALLCCNSFSVSGQSGDPDLSLAAAINRKGTVRSLIGVVGAVPTRVGIEERFAELAGLGESVGAIANQLNELRQLQIYGATVVVSGDPSVALRGPLSAGFSVGFPGVPEVTTIPTSDPDERAEASVDRLVAFMRRRTHENQVEGMAAAIDPSTERALQDLVLQAPTAKIDGAQVLERLRSLKVDSLYYGRMLRPRSAVGRRGGSRCSTCGSSVIRWLARDVDYSERWCVVCGHLDAGHGAPSLSAKMSVVGKEGTLRIRLRASSALGWVSVRVRDEDHRRLTFDTIEGVGDGRAREWKQRTVAPLSTGRHTLHVLSLLPNGSLRSYRGVWFLRLGARAQQAAEMSWSASDDLRGVHRD